MRVDGRFREEVLERRTGGQITAHAGSSKPVSHWITWSSSAFVALPLYLRQ